MADVTICGFGCSSVDGCMGDCLPPPLTDEQARQALGAYATGAPLSAIAAALGTEVATIIGGIVRMQCQSPTDPTRRERAVSPRNGDE